MENNLTFSPQPAAPVQDPTQWTPKERVFAAIYLKSLNCREAAETIGMPVATCHYMLKQSHVNDYITSVLSAKLLNSTQVEAGICDLATITKEDFFTIDESGHPRLDLNKARTRGVLGAVKEFVYDEHGRATDVRLYDRLDALKVLAKRHGMLGERLEVSGDINVNVKAVRETMAAAMSDPGRLLGMIDLAEQLAAKRLPAGTLGGGNDQRQADGIGP